MLEKRNSEGYPDPTAYEALLRIELAGKASAFRPLVFLCSPFAGDVAGNTEKARAFSRFAVERNCIPVAPHLLFPQFMDDADPNQRDLAVFMGLVLLSKCLELWVFGGVVTAGMSVELAKAKQRDIRIRYFTEQLEEVGAP